MLVVRQAFTQLGDLQNAMIDYFREHKKDAANGLELLPGVKELLAMLKVGITWLPIFAYTGIV